MRALSFSETLRWRRRIRDAGVCAALPPSSPRPNPALIEGLLVTSFLHGFVLAVDPGSGETVWRREIGDFASASVYHAEGILFACSANTVLALAPASGEVLWQFTRVERRGPAEAHVTGLSVV